MGVRHAEYLAPVPSAPPPPTPDMAFAGVQPTAHTAMHAPRFVQGAPESISASFVPHSRGTGNHFSAATASACASLPFSQSTSQLPLSASQSRMPVEATMTAARLMQRSQVGVDTCSNMVVTVHSFWR